VSSIGSVGADLPEGWGCFENSTIVSRMDCANMGLVVSRRGGVDEVPLHEVRIQVFDGLTKHNRDAPMVLSVLHRKGRSGSRRRCRQHSQEGGRCCQSRHRQGPRSLIMPLLVHEGAS